MSLPGSRPRLVEHRSPQRLVGLQRLGTLTVGVQADHQPPRTGGSAQSLRLVASRASRTASAESLLSLAACAARVQATDSSSSKESRAALAHAAYGSSASSLPRHQVQTQRHVRQVTAQQGAHRGHVDPYVLGIQQVPVVRGGQRATPAPHQPEPAPQRARSFLHIGDVARRGRPSQSRSASRSLAIGVPRSSASISSRSTRLVASQVGGHEPDAGAADHGRSEYLHIDHVCVPFPTDMVPGKDLRRQPCMGGSTRLRQ